MGPLQLLLEPFLAPIRGKKSYAIGTLLVANALYTAVFGEPPPGLDTAGTWDTPTGEMTTAETAISGALGAGIMSLRAGITKLDAALTVKIAELATKLGVEPEDE